ncbi:LacI family DNA-binding transcriptional regulator [Croceivirga sp. JEA036]|uniref:LacI family DNA-binding transcriptional regulator n=1 Tax=Croceivirga sp. JEA036 TaxID=2721162 RepID=UPI00143A2D8C|nr:LacI family DNA-binding transcriptional regulator [Croceivirga sp. JEA036]NJB36234.1 LacI family transcriptional regulator [Croceivirga sp. JEA036]
MSRTTLQQIALSLDISVTTVSKALNGYPDVSKKTIEKVKAAAERLNYKPNSFAVNLRKQQSMTIGLVVPEIVHQFFSNVVKGIIDEAEKHGYVVITLHTNQKYNKEKQVTEFLIDKQVDGILIALADETVEVEHLLAAQKLDIPVVMFDKISKNVECSKVLINDVEAAFEATNHLIKTGCKKIAHFRGPQHSQNAIDRFEGYKKALLENNLEFKEEHVFPCHEMSFEVGIENIKKLLNTTKGIDGIFINTDLIAVGAMAELRDQGIRIPEDISIVGFSNWFLSSVTSPTLTTVAQPSLSMGKIAFNMLLSELTNKRNNVAIAHETIYLPTELIIRKSTRPL